VNIKAFLDAEATLLPNLTSLRLLQLRPREERRNMSLYTSSNLASCVIFSMQLTILRTVLKWS